MSLITPVLLVRNATFTWTPPTSPGGDPLVLVDFDVHALWGDTTGVQLKTADPQMCLGASITYGDNLISKSNQLSTSDLTDLVQALNALGTDSTGIGKVRNLELKDGGPMCGTNSSCSYTPVKPKAEQWTLVIHGCFLTDQSTPSPRQLNGVLSLAQPDLQVLSTFTPPTS